MIVQGTPDQFHERLFKVRWLVEGLHRGIPFDPLVLTPDELERRLSSGDQFIAKLLKNGKVLHAG